MEISIQNVSVTYSNGKQALKDLSLDLLAPGMFLLLVPNAARNSSLIRLLAPTLVPPSGLFRVNGTPLSISVRSFKS